MLSLPNNNNNNQNNNNSSSTGMLASNSNNNNNYNVQNSSSSLNDLTMNLTTPRSRAPIIIAVAESSKPTDPTLKYNDTLNNSLSTNNNSNNNDLFDIFNSESDLLIGMSGDEPQTTTTTADNSGNLITNESLNKPYIYLPSNNNNNISSKGIC
jgi:hypothetical protein